jgi:TolB-like protein/Tfp pilus assembly protein PilF
LSLVAELKRRNVFKVGTAYLALGWVITQVTATVVPYMRLPEWTVPMVVWIGVIGFPCVLIFSWAYELTPEGLKRESEVDRSASITQNTGKRLDYIIIGLLVAAIAMFALNRFAPPSAMGAGNANGPRDSGLAGTTGAAEEDRGHGPLPQASPTAAASAPAPAPAFAPDAKSIAVMPFVNMSSDKEQDYFSDGLSEELLNLLARIPELRVTSRSSAFAFKGKETETPEIARRLNVAHILEGSVRKSGERVRITAQLIDTRSDTHLWSQSWDRTLEDIFAVQDEIAAAVAAQLKITLLGEAPTTTKVDPKAYALFLRAREMSRQGTPEGFERAIALLQQALEIDPRYASALTALAGVYGQQIGNGLRPVDAGNHAARELADKALAIEPNDAATHALLGKIALRYDRDIAAAARLTARAVELAPGDVDVLNAAANQARALGRFELNRQLLEYIIARDPVSSAAHGNLGLALVAEGRFDVAIAEFRTVLDLNPARLGAHYNIAEAQLRSGDAEAALASLQGETLPGWKLIGTAIVQHTRGDKAASDAALAQLMAGDTTGWEYNIAYIHAWRHERDQAFDWLDKAVASNDPGLSEIVGEGMFAKIHDDPRWLPFLRRIGSAPDQLAAIPFDVRVPGTTVAAAEPSP